jgi:hypothetical protein
VFEEQHRAMTGLFDGGVELVSIIQRGQGRHLP